MSNQIVKCEECEKEGIAGLGFYEFKANRHRCLTCSERVKEYAEMEEEYSMGEEY